MSREFHSDSALIDRLGGPAALARRLGFKKESGVQRVSNWRYRGIPAAVKLDNKSVFDELKNVA